MHHCLEITEIQRAIFQWVAAEAPILDGDHPAAALAITCSAFLEPALDVLWHSILSLEPLLKVMPADLWKVTHHRLCRTRLSFTRPVVDADWIRFDFYAPRIKRLGYSDSLPYFAPRVSLDSAVYDALASRHATHTVLPSVRDLFWIEYSEDRFPYIGIFIGPQLVTLRTIATVGIQNLRPVISSLPRDLEALELLDLTTINEGSPHKSSMVSDAVCRCRRLQKISFGYSITLSRDAIRYLASSSEIRELSVEMDSARIAEALSNMPAKSAFTSLQQLSLKCSHIISFSRLPPLMDATHLQSLEITLGQFPTSSDLKTFFQLLGSFLDYKNFSCLTISPDLRTVGPMENTFLSATHIISEIVLEPLHVFKNLTSLILAIRTTFEIDNDVLGKMASWWPRLEKLRLGGTTGWGKPSPVTLHGLVPLIQRCPHLCELALVITAFLDEPYSRQNPETRACNKAITYLDLGDSIVRDMNEVAAFLYDFFPNLRNIGVNTEAEGEGRFRGPLKRRWGLVVSRIEILSKSDGNL